ncbi:MAG: hypothetical protein ACREP7_14765, partial [Lysobacter sp.]
VGAARAATNRRDVRKRPNRRPDRQNGFTRAADLSFGKERGISPLRLSRLAPLLQSDIDCAANQRGIKSNPNNTGS